MTPHGSASTYTNHGCRCDPCRKAHSAQHSVRQAERVAALRDGWLEVEHGRFSTYCNYGCRCDSCRAAATERGRAARKAAR